MEGGHGTRSGKKDGVCVKNDLSSDHFKAGFVFNDFFFDRLEL